MLTYKIHLIRSGSSDYPGRPAVLGQENLPLSPNGINFLKELLKNFNYPDVELVYTSPLKQCIETAEIIFPDKKPVVKSELLDMDLGEFEGKTYEELVEDEDFKKWIQDSVGNTPPYGESAQDFTLRIVNIIDDIFNEMNKKKIYNVAIVANSGFIMTLLSTLGLPKMPMDRWQSENGTGFTMMTSVQMWMRDGVFEIIGNVPSLD